MNSVLIH